MEFHFVKQISRSRQMQQPYDSSCKAQVNLVRLVRPEQYRGQ